ncbi:MAG: integral rane sensor signal transduction histidine kinase [Solirubrobacterales bacterium]|nr:integral rane sensor signal transduction histidine kinase [Solirubrobacterales bacterium]
MRSLRSRLLVSVLGIAALGLVLLAAIVYAEQRSSLYSRLDTELRQAPDAMGRVLIDKAIGRGDDADGLPPRPGAQRGPGARGPAGTLPPGTYGELRDASGKLIGSPVTVGYDAGSTTGPKLPASPPHDKIFTSGHYRVLVQALPGGATIAVAVPTGETGDTLSQLLLVEGLVILGVLALLGGVAWIVVRIGLLPLDRIGFTAGRIAGGDLSHRVESTDPRTEVGRLGVSLNAMLDRLEHAFAERQASEDRLRRFLADASHELRTPLSSIRGYAELYRMGATREPAELERSMQRIEDEAQRMGVLVEDLLTLARLDEIADAPHVEVDVGALARDAVDDARATAPDREITLQAEGAALVEGDADQLRQVLGNLVRNALVHTPAGTPIEVQAARENGEVRVEVRDHGPGLPDGDGEAIFERFWRAEHGRERGKDGAGLGLAIVAGIVDAHGGSVSARNAEDGGAAFVVTLPARSA